MKNILNIAILLIGTSFGANAQQDPMVTQYMFNGLYINPAYAGSHKYWSSTLSYRTQWVGAQFDGAPQTGVVAVDGPIAGKNMGLGFIATHDQIGVTKTSSFMGNYAYQLKFNNDSKLAFGISAGLTQVNAQLTEVLVWDDQDDVYQNNLNKTLPRIGVGAFYFSDRYYVGLSVPTILAYEEGSPFSMDLDRASFLRRHYMLTGGVVLDVSENVKFKPSFMMKYVKNAPLQADINFSAVFQDAFWVGATYRTMDAVSLIFEYQTNKYFRIGYAYDITVSGLRGYQNGSHEIMIGVDFGKDLIKVKTPRYF